MSVGKDVSGDPYYADYAVKQAEQKADLKRRIADAGKTMMYGRMVDPNNREEVLAARNADRAGRGQAPVGGGSAPAQAPTAYASSQQRPAPQPPASTAALLRPGYGAAVSQGGADRQSEMRLAAKLAQEGFDHRASSIKGMMGAEPGMVDYSGPIQAQEDAARGAAFARAKETAGMTARASLTALDDVAAGSGQFGGSEHALGVGQTVGMAGRGVNDFMRMQTEEDLNRARQVADMRYQGGVTQRGQDMSRRQSLLSLLSSGGLY